MSINRGEEILIMFCYELLYCVDKCKGSERVHRDNEEQMEYICLCFVLKL